MLQSNRVVQLLTLISFGISYSAFAVTPVLEWKLDSVLKNPESAIYDKWRNIIYVSNMNGEPTAVDGNGFITKIGVDGSVIEPEWIKGLDAPKGMAVTKEKLYVSDITTIVEIDIATGSISKRYVAEGAQYLNDLVADYFGNIYISDMVTNTLYRLIREELKVWITDSRLENPNGLTFGSGPTGLTVGSWGKMNPDFSTNIPGHLKTVHLITGDVSSLGSDQPIGNLDGVESDGKGNFYVTDWMNGKLFLVSQTGESQMLLDLDMGSADIGYIPKLQLLLIPMMLNDSLLAYKMVQ